MAEKTYVFNMKESLARATVTIETMFKNCKLCLAIRGTFYSKYNKEWGQCIDSIKEYLDTHEGSLDKDKEDTFNKLYYLWENYHLNVMHAGTVEQEKALKDKFGRIIGDSYKEHVEYLKSINMYEVDILINGEPQKYAYGTEWLLHEIPSKDIELIKELVK